jgi:hypothetical protein
VDVGLSIASEVSDLIALNPFRIMGINHVAGNKTILVKNVIVVLILIKNLIALIFKPYTSLKPVLQFYGGVHRG